MKRCYLYVLTVMLPILLTVICLYSVIVNNNQAIMPIPLEINFTGEYSYDGENWSILTPDSDISALKGNVIVKGHFDKSVNEGAILTFFCNHIGASVYVNGEMLYLDAQSEIIKYGIDLMPAMCGKRWEQIRCPAISEDDEIEIRFVNHHKHGNKTAYREALITCYVTSDNSEIMECYLKPYRKPLQIIGFAILIVSIMLIGASMAAFFAKSYTADRLFKMGMAALFSSGYIIFDVMMIYLMDELLVVKTYGKQLCMMLAIYFVCLIIKDSFRNKKKKIADILMIMSWLANMLIIGHSILGNVLIYDTQVYWEISQIIVCSIMISMCVHELINENKKSRVEYVNFIVLLISILLDIIDVGYTMYVPDICFKMVFVFIVIEYIARGTKRVFIEHQASLKNKKLQDELENNRIAVMLSQIQPHFLYNVIGTIRALCRTDSEQAWKALGDFSNYLRGNMSALSNSDMVHFTTELRHIEAYLRLEKMRMGDELNIVYDIQEKDFFIPPLTVQPLVENAVKHGLFEKDGGGTISIHSRYEEGNIVVEVKDNGVGFDVNEPLKQDEQHTHVGLSNVKKRLEKISGGQIIIETAIGKGTEIRVLLPQNSNIRGPRRG